MRTGYKQKKNGQVLGVCCMHQCLTGLLAFSVAWTVLAFVFPYLLQLFTVLCTWCNQVGDIPGHQHDTFFQAEETWTMEMDGPCSHRG